MPNPDSADDRAEMAEKYTDQDSKSTFDFAVWGERVVRYAPKEHPPAEPSSSRFVSEPVETVWTEESVGGPEWKDLPTLVRRSFDAFLIMHAEAIPETVAFQLEDPIRIDGEDALIPYADKRSGEHYVARCAPDGGVRLER
jgi:hypothetical protein